MSTVKTLSLKCLCGKFSHTHTPKDSELPLPLYYCHCNSCRHSLGSLAAFGVIWPDNLVNLDGLSKYAFSPRVAVHFCSTCGSHLFATSQKQQASRLFAFAGLLENQDEVISVKEHIWLEDTKDGGLADWVSEINGTLLTRFARSNQEDALYPIHDVSATKEIPLLSNSDVLKGSCLCKGVQFSITRPSAGPCPSEDKGNEWWLLTDNRYPTGLCACRSCCLAGSSDVTAWAYVPSANIRVGIEGGKFSNKDTFGTLKWYQSSEPVRRSFCAQCGAGVFYSHDTRNVDAETGLITVAVGLLNSEEGARADDWLWWRTTTVGMEKDSKNKKVLQSMAAGLKEWGSKHYGDDHPLMKMENKGALFSKLSRAATLK